MPIETDPACFEASLLVTHLGIIVVEAVGNGGADLDRFQRNGQFVLRRNTSDFRDSGAIVVGCTSAVHQRISFSNFGSRADCCAWTENEFTTGDPARPEARDGFTRAQRHIQRHPDHQLALPADPGPAYAAAGEGTGRSARRPVVPGIGVMPDGAAIVSNEYVV